tara:strand:+ start:3067 stop:3789 length:723 start_codon:yes stop_codon:yes gene_type:complete
MDSNIKASFIPDKVTPTSSGGSRMRGEGGVGDILVLLAVVILAAALALAAGVFLYDRFLVTSVEKKNAQLNRAKEAFDPILIQELVRLDARLNASADVLAKHLAPSEVFSLLESLTLQSIEYESLDYGIGEDGVIRITMNGKAQSVNGVALQSSVFGAHNAIINPIFSDLDLTGDGVTFSVVAELDPLALQYALVAQKNAAAAASALPQEAVETPQESVDTEFDNLDDFGDFGEDTSDAL